ncbi:MAG: alpha-glucuronidase family glycosyl hydrolase [Candidatus Sulfotelmatobacter sp.]
MATANVKGKGFDQVRRKTLTPKLLSTHRASRISSLDNIDSQRCLAFQHATLCHNIRNTCTLTIWSPAGKNLKLTIHFIFVFACVLCTAATTHAETGHDAWLRYARLEPAAAERYRALPATVLSLDHTIVSKSAQDELVRGVKGMLGRTLRIAAGPPTESAIVIGTAQQLRNIAPALQIIEGLHGDSFWLTTGAVRGLRCMIITAATDRGVLYGVFAFLNRIAMQENVFQLNELQEPSVPIRWANQWDNLDGTIERGDAGRSIFFENGSVRPDLARVSEYARLLASVGINGCTVNNVNADPHILDPAFIPQLARIAEAFRPWGVQLGIAVDLSLPKTSGALDTFDPLDPRVATWWQKKFDEIYRNIPDFGGVVVKADSEGRSGPSLYQRTPSDAANVIARALKPHRGIVFYRAFVYNHHLDWTDLKNDRAKAAYEVFHPLDGKFDDNVIIQIKYGPIDFQVREPVSPLLGGLPHTNTGIELQVTQEYTGQQRHTCFLVPMWKEILDFNLRVNGYSTPVKQIVAGKSFHRPLGGYIGVVNAGLDQDWMGNHLAMANLYGFGRLAWNPNLMANAIIDEWTRLTFGNDPVVVQTISRIQLASWQAYENYTGVLGLQTLTNILGSHYGPAPESQERNGWGQWIRADARGVGVDRSVATGTGFVGQYSPDVQKLYESLANTPDDLLLFFHHVPYTYKLHSGKTVIQTIYDSHYAGAEKTKQFVSQWQSLHRRIDDERFHTVLAQLTYQSGHAIVWRDAINDWFHQISGIPDANGRVGNHPHRIEAESMELRGYTPLDVTPWEDASAGKAIVCVHTAQCTAKYRFAGAKGWYEIDVEYFDQNNGVSKYEVYVGDQLVDEWLADSSLPATAPNGDSSTRRHIPGVALRPGDVLRIEGFPDAAEAAPLDYVEIYPEATPR